MAQYSSGTARTAGGAESIKRPNAFVSLRIRSDSVRRGLGEVQTAMVEKDRAVEKALTSLDKLHVTLSVIHLEDEDEEEKAGKALLEATHKLNEKMGLDRQPLTLQISGLGSFGQGVVFAEIVQKEQLREVAEVVRGVFAEHGFPDVDGRDINPHLTIAKMPKKTRGRGRGGRGGRGRGGRGGRGGEVVLNGLHEELYADFKDREFGVEKVSAIELLSMSRPSAEDNYYHCFQEYSFEEVGIDHATRN